VNREAPRHRCGRIVGQLRPRHFSEHVEKPALRFAGIFLAIEIQRSEIEHFCAGIVSRRE
jgi:hypothetical protein